MKKLSSLAELRELMRVSSQSPTEQGRVSMLLEHYVDAPELYPSGDPFSAGYRASVQRIHTLVSQKPDYSPATHELIPIEPKSRARRPGIYVDGGSRHLGTFLEAIGQIFQVLDLQPGSRVVEYGPGDGQIALPLARNGCEVTVIDIDPNNLEAVRLQAQAMDIPIDCRQAEFAADHGLRDLDAAIFFESFHHAIDHVRVLENLRKSLKPSGRIIFAGEPIIEQGSPWSHVAPFPWGLRLDALSLSAVAHYGWMELGFQEGYFNDLMARHGWAVQRVESRTNGRGTCRIAVPM
jgi:2-polyprenyl-3-methyl-5-hydroxy-6-metoxy-1,4-benzoquinol methylase